MTVRELDQLVLDELDGPAHSPSEDRRRVHTMLTSDGKTLYQEEVDSSRAVGVALVASASAVFATLVALLILVAI